jgi:hypothetical protein
MKREDMICLNCMNGEQRVAGDSAMVKCFLNPEIIVKGQYERCAQGQWLFDKHVYVWGEI